MQNVSRLKIYNFLTRKKEAFRPLRTQWVGLYACGPTVYNFVHLGNLRTYIFEDVLRRTLAYAGLRVRHIMNITDVDDKIIHAAQEKRVDIRSFTAPFEKAFFEDIKKLHILPAAKFPRATKEITAMVRLITRLLKRGIAYEADGSVYFNIRKYNAYGRLSRLDISQLKTKSRIDIDEYSKNEAEDFVLWKGTHKGEPSWPAPFGRGRPGWHIECSAMSMKYLGETIDIHAGGIDLLFPHHENEIAQSESATGKTFVRYVVEGAHLLVNGEKMAKSLGNIITLRDLEKGAIPPLAFRMLALGAHYRSKLNFTWQSLNAAEHALERLYACIRELKLKSKYLEAQPQKSSKVRSRKFQKWVARYKKAFEDAIFDDLNTPRALAVVWRLIDSYHKNHSAFEVKSLLKLLYEFDAVLGLGMRDVTVEKIPKKIKVLIQKREALRQEKRFHEADEIRKEISRLGFMIEDTAEGARIIKNSNNSC